MQLYRKIRKLIWKGSMKGLPRGPHITRYFMYNRLRSIGHLLPSRTGRILSISHSTNLSSLLGLQPTEVVGANYPDQNILSLNFRPSGILPTILSFLTKC